MFKPVPVSKESKTDDVNPGSIACRDEIIPGNITNITTTLESGWMNIKLPTKQRHTPAFAGVFFDFKKMHAVPGGTALE